MRTSKRIFASPEKSRRLRERPLRRRTVGSFLTRAVLIVLVAGLVVQFEAGIAGAGGSGGGGTGAAGGGGGAPSVPLDSVIAATAPVSLPGGGGVSDSGSATYDLPFDLPDGPGGLKPSLGISYNGGGGNGILGTGFGLTGLSVIAPCHKSFASEGTADGIDFDATDVYCLDGQKLVPRNDVKLSAAVEDVVLGTEIESFVRVVMHREFASDPQPSTFTVFHPDGRKAYYEPVSGIRTRGVGPEEDPVFQGHGDDLNANEAEADMAVAYPIRRIADRSGNEIRYQYEIGYDVALENERSYRISDIEYSHNSSQVPRRRIEIEYESRGDQIIEYVSGVKMVTRSRVSSIRMFAPNPVSTDLVWRYRFNYEYGDDTRRSRLTAVWKEDFAGTPSWKRRFHWSEADAGVKDHPTGEVEFDPESWSMDLAGVERQNAHGEQPDGSPHFYYEPWYPKSDMTLLVFDADGNGIDDVLYRTHPTKIRYWREEPVAMLPQGTSYDRGRIRLRRTVGDTLLGELSDQTIYLELSTDDVPYSPAEIRLQAHLAKSRVADFDGDGFLEMRLARVSFQGSGLWTHPLDSESDQNQGYWVFGYADLGSFTPSNGYWERPFPLDWPTTFSREQIHGPVFRFSHNNGPYNTPLFRFFEPTFQQVLADVDGDGIPEEIDPFFFTTDDTLDFEPIDIVAFPDVDWSNPTWPDPATTFPYLTRLSTMDAVTSFSAASGPAAHWFCKNDHALITDYEGDGRADVLVASTQISSEHGAMGVYARLRTDDGLSTESDESSKAWGGDCNGASPDVLLGDWNGDGLEDLLYPPGAFLSVPDGDSNKDPLVRWNLGNGYDRTRVFPVDDAVLEDMMEARQPISVKSGSKVGWDLGTRVVDLNGDGRSDILAMRYEDDSFLDIIDGEVWQSLPMLALFLTPKVVIAYISTGDGFVATNLGTWSSQISVADGFSTFQVGDLTGDGAVDFVHVEGDQIVVTELPWRTKPDRLVEVTDDGSGYPLERFTYTSEWWGSGPRPEPETCLYPIQCTRRGMDVVRMHEVFAGSKPDGSSRYRQMLHSFSGPRTNVRGRGFLGFAEHRIWDRELGAETIRTFDNVGPLDPDFSLDGGEIYPRAGVPVSIRTVVPIDTMPTDLELQTSDVNFPGQPGPTAVIPTRTVTETFDYQVTPTELQGQTYFTRLLVKKEVLEEDIIASAVGIDDEVPHYSSWQPYHADSRTTTTNIDYGAFGQPELTVTTVTGGTQTSVEKRYEERVLPPSSGVSDWYLGLVNFTHVRVREPNEAPEEAVGRVTRASYNAGGLPTSITISGRDEAFYACQGPEAACEALEIDALSVTVDSYLRGSPTHVTTTAVDVPTPRTATIDYDVDGVYPRAFTDSLGFITHTLRHPALGVPVLMRDANNVTTKIQYDGFGRPVKTTPDGGAVTTVKYEEVASGPSPGTIGLKVSTTEQTGATASEWSKQTEITDELGRTIYTSQSGFDPLQTIVSDVEYDHFGNVVRVSNPAFNNLTSDSTQYSFDRLGRLLSVVNAANEKTKHTHEMYSTRTEDPVLNVTYVDRDHDGRVIESGHLVSNQKRGEVRASYGPFHQIVEIEDANGNATTRSYDALGRLRHLSDPDTGESDYAYDGFGQLVTETRANGDVIQNEYDVLGRIKSVDAGPDGIDEFFYDIGPNARHRLSYSISFDDVTSVYAYDSFGRMVEKTQTMDGTTRVINQRFDAYGRVSHLFYPEVAGFNRVKIQNEYGSGGHLRKINDVSACSAVLPDPATAATCASSVMRWQVLGRDANLSLTQAKYGNNQVETREYYPLTGRPKKLSAAGTVIEYKFWEDGNLKERLDQTGRKETFVYDELDRLVSWTLKPPAERGPVQDIVTTYGYDELGNLELVKKGTTATFVGTYAWPGKPHQLAMSSNSGGGIFYDDVGRQTNGMGRNIEWRYIDKPESITENGITKVFRYDANGERVSAVAPNDTTIYFDGLYERRVEGAVVSNIFYIHGEPGVVAQIEYVGASTTNYKYMVTDHQSTVNLTFAPGTKRDYFDPFGKRIDALGNSAVDSDASTTVGYTGQEEDDGNLVNMGGRIYDRKQYRFLSPDPMIADPLFGQSYNPYSYVLNNPLRYTDPSGYQAVDGDPGERVVSRSPTNAGGEVVVVPRGQCKGAPGTCDEKTNAQGWIIASDTKGGSNKQPSTPKWAASLPGDLQTIAAERGWPGVEAIMAASQARAREAYDERAVKAYRAWQEAEQELNPQQKQLGEWNLFGLYTPPGTDNEDVIHGWRLVNGIKPATVGNIIDNVLSAFTSLAIPHSVSSSGRAIGAWKEANAEWSVVRARIGVKYGLPPHTIVHHWAIPQGGTGKLSLQGIFAEQWGRIFPSYIKNSRFNLMLPPRSQWGPISTHWHIPLHGKTSKLYGSLKLYQRLWHGSPTWAKGAAAGVPVGAGAVEYYRGTR